MKIVTLVVAFPDAFRCLRLQHSTALRARKCNTGAKNSLEREGMIQEAGAIGLRL